MEQVTAIGLDIARHVFQVHGVDAAGKVLIQRNLRRVEVLEFFGKFAPIVVGIEAWASSHYWARELSALGHNVKLMPPHYVKPYGKRQKNGMADAAAICEAALQPSMQCVPVQTKEQQAVLVIHRSRELLIRQHTMLIHALRAHLAEFGIIVKYGKAGAASLVARIEYEDHDMLDPMVREALLPLAEQLRETGERISRLEQRIVA